jgi:hypothetical protein
MTFMVRPRTDVSASVEIGSKSGTHNPRSLDEGNCGIQGARPPGLIYLQIH